MEGVWSLLVAVCLQSFVRMILVRTGTFESRQTVVWLEHRQITHVSYSNACSYFDLTVLNLG